jgi:hypothetical protein
MNMMKKITLFALLIIILTSFCTTIRNYDYRFYEPDKVITLPSILHEISGLAVLDSANVGCIQDENGILFIYNIKEERVTREMPFHFDGDYEDIALVGSTLFILRSDGALYEIKDYRMEKPDVTAYDTGIPANDNEGLCYDKSNNRLLIAVKGKHYGEKETKDTRFIYAFDLSIRKLVKEPAYSYNLRTIRSFIKRNNIPVKKKENLNNGTLIAQADVKFAASAIAIHPHTNKLYLLSANDHMLFIFNTKGDIENAYSLPKNLYNKAEGIDFLQNGDMLISNEGGEKQPTLILLRNRSKF